MFRKTQKRHYFAVFIAFFAEIGIHTAEIGNPKVKIGIFAMLKYWRYI